jgi:hypothetical protein
LRRQSNAGQQMVLFSPPNRGRRGTINIDNNTFAAKTDEQGNFVLDQVPPGNWKLYLVPGLGIPFSHQTEVQIQPGATLQVQVGGTGAVVSGRFAAPDPGSKVNWSKQLRFASLVTQSAPLPRPAGLNREESQRWESDFWESPEGLARLRNMRSYSLTVEPDGSFIVEDVEPGNYYFSGQLYDAPPAPGNPLAGQNLGSLHQEIVVPEPPGDPAAQSLDVGTVSVRLFSARRKGL